MHSHSRGPPSLVGARRMPCCAARRRSWSISRPRTWHPGIRRYVSTRPCPRPWRAARPIWSRSRYGSSRAHPATTLASSRAGCARYSARRRARRCRCRKIGRWRRLGHTSSLRCTARRSRSGAISPPSGFVRRRPRSTPARAASSTPPRRRSRCAAVTSASKGTF